MSVHPSPRLPAAAGDAAPTPGAEATGGGDLFNSLVSGLVGTGAATADGDAEPAVAAADGTQTPPAATKDVPESVEQLLALVGASRSHGAGKKTGAASDAEGKDKDDFRGRDVGQSGIPGGGDSAARRQPAAAGADPGGHRSGDDARADAACRLAGSSGRRRARREPRD